MSKIGWLGKDFLIEGNPSIATNNAMTGIRSSLCTFATRECEGRCSCLRDRNATECYHKESRGIHARSQTEHYLDRRPVRVGCELKNGRRNLDRLTQRVVDDHEHDSGHVGVDPVGIRDRE